MKLDIIKVNSYLLAVDKEQRGKKGWNWLKVKIGNNPIINLPYNYETGSFEEMNSLKIIAHLPLNNAAPLEGVLLLPESEDAIELLAYEAIPINEYGQIGSGNDANKKITEIENEITKYFKNEKDNISG